MRAFLRNVATGALLLIVAVWVAPGFLPAAQITSYEGSDGLLVAKVAAVSRGAQPLSPEEPPSSCSGGCGCGAGKAVRVTLVTGRTLTLQGLPEEAPRYRLAERPPRPILAETPPGTVMDALVESPLLAYEPATQTLLFAASPQAGPLEGLLFHVKAAEGDVWTIEDSEEAPPVLSPKVLEVVRQMVERQETGGISSMRQPSGTAPAARTVAVMERSLQQSVFRELHGRLSGIEGRMLRITLSPFRHYPGLAPDALRTTKAKDGIESMHVRLAKTSRIFVERRAPPHGRSPCEAEMLSRFLNAYVVVSVRLAGYQAAEVVTLVVYP